ncbi:MAG: hypothetical protein ACJAYC_000602 [Halieaceae bacterium]|jgi:hypothetical protein
MSEEILGSIQGPVSRGGGRRKFICVKAPDWLERYWLVEVLRLTLGEQSNSLLLRKVQMYSKL